MIEKVSLQKQNKYYNELSNYKYKCKCGHTVVIPETNKKGYAICKWCGNKVDKKESKNLKYLKQIDLLKRYWNKRKENEQA